MKLNDLKKKGGVIEPELVKEHIKWTHRDKETGEIITDEFDVFILKASWGAVSDVVSNDAPGYNASVGMIAECVKLGESGEENLSYEDAYALDNSLAQQFLAAVNRVNQNNEKK